MGDLAGARARERRRRSSLVQRRHRCARSDALHDPSALRDRVDVRPAGVGAGSVDGDNGRGAQEGVRGPRLRGPGRGSLEECVASRGALSSRRASLLVGGAEPRASRPDRSARSAAHERIGDARRLVVGDRLPDALSLPPAAVAVATRSMDRVLGTRREARPLPGAFASRPRGGPRLHHCRAGISRAARARLLGHAVCRDRRGRARRDHSIRGDLSELDRPPRCGLGPRRGAPDSSGCSWVFERPSRGTAFAFRASAHSAEESAAWISRRHSGSRSV